MDFTRALTYPFDDQDWLKKIGLGVLIQFIPVIGQFALQGWSFEISKRVRRNDPFPLPDWSNFGGLLSKGFMLFLAIVIYQIPTIIFACVASFVWIIPAMGAGNEDAAAALAGVAGIVVMCCSCLIVLYAIVASVVYWGGYIRYIDREEFGTFFQFGDNIALVRNNIGDFGMALLYVVLAGAIVSVASSVTFGLGGLVATPFTMYFVGHILGQLAAKLSGEAAPMVPAV